MCPEPRRERAIVLPVALFELRLHLRSPTFWIVVAVSALMVLGSLTVERIQIGPLRGGVRNSVEAIVYIHLVWSLFFLFTATAFATDAALRDDANGFDPILRSTPARPRDIALGRFIGSFAALVLAFLSVPAAAYLAPWLAPNGALGASDPGALLYGLVLLALPNLFLASALFGVLAAATRSALAAYLGAVALLVLYGLGAGDGVGPAAGTTRAILEPFGFGAYVDATAGWTAAERAARLPALAGPLLWNRALWLAVGCGCLALALTDLGWTPGRSGRARPTESEDAELSPSFLTRREPVFTRATTLAQLAARTRFEAGFVGRSPFLVVLIVLGAASAVLALSPISGAGAAFPSGTDEVIRRVDEAFRLAPVVVAVFYAGELVWGEKDRGMHELIAAAPIPDWAGLVPKVLALALVLGATVLASALAGIAMQALRGGDGVDLAAWLARYVVPRTYDLTLVAILAVFFQALSPGKLVGFGWMTLFFVVSVSMESAGLNDDLYRYGGHADTLSAALASTERSSLVRAYWGAFGLVLAVLAHLLVGRGAESRLAPRLARLPGRLRGPAGASILAGAVGFVALGLVLARY